MKTPTSQLSIEVLVEAARSGNPDDQYVLGVIFDEGIGVERDTETAIEWYRKAASSGHHAATYRLFFLDDNWLVGERGETYTENFDKVIEAARGGYPVAAMDVYQTYGGEPDEAQDQDLAMECLEIAFQAEYGPAMIEMAEHFQSGKVIPKDLGRSIEILERAWELGDPDAGAMLGNTVLRDLDPPEIERGMELLTEAAGKGSALAAGSVGWIYQQGLYGQPQDVELSVKYSSLQDKLNQYFISRLARHSEW